MSVIDGPSLSNNTDLIFYLDAANPKSYSGSGSTWYDLTANGNHFTLFNTPTYTSNGTTGTYLSFNGSNQYVRSTNAINFNAYSAVTIEIGYRTTVTNTTQMLYETTGTGASTATGGITLLMNSNNTGTVANTYLSQWQGYGTRLFGYTVSTNTAFNAITETFVNGVDASGRQTYVNSTLTTYFTNTSVVSAATTTTSGLAFANTWTYVASRAGSSNFFRGDIAYIKVYGVKISSTNISSNLTTIGLKQPASYPTPTLITNDSSIVSASLYSFTSFQFTNAGALGNTGPTLANCLSSYNTVTYPWLNNTAYFNVVTQGIQLWTVPATGTYRLTLKGGDGGGANSASYNNRYPGAGAVIITDVTLTGGTVLSIVVGQTPNCGSSTLSGTGGGGGTWIYTGSIGGAGLIAVAGGGGGWGHGSNATNGGIGLGGSSTNSSTSNSINGNVVAAADSVSYQGNGTGASNGTGYGGGLATTGQYGSGAGGAGWLSVGTSTNGTSGPGGGQSGGYPSQGGQQWVGGTGGANNAGGFGGGGGSNGNGSASGGGGGYTGGPAGNDWSGSYWGNAGGGGSYWTGSLVSATAGANGIAYASVTHGYVTITKL
jgi:hypothetical protein